MLKFDNTVSGSGSLTVGGLGNAGDIGTLVLNGANTYSGGTTVNLGTLTLKGATAKLGTGNVLVDGLSAGTAGKMIILSEVLNAIADSATLNLTGGGSGGFADLGYVELNANDTVAGLVLGGVVKGPGTYGGTSSTATFQDDEYFAGSGILTVAAGLSGDYNSDGKVDAGDYVSGADTRAPPIPCPTTPPAGPSGPQRYTTWRSNYGKPPGSGSGLSASAVPEASTLTLVGILTILLGTRRSFGNNTRV